MKRIIFVAFTIFTFSCNSNPDTKSNASDIKNASGEISANPAGVNSTTASEANATEITVTLTGGANAGTYQVSSKRATCSEGLTGEGSFGNQYSESDKADNELSSVQLIIDDKNEAKKGTGRFSIQVAFGKLLQGKTYEINNSTMNPKQGGSGKATLSESSGSKKVIVEGKTADGVGISAIIICNTMVGE